uniref:Uncharacterized protein n=1 Tax=Ciona savignyi TaxID=51511 RepID=H2ZQ95_CIOSA
MLSPSTVGGEKSVDRGNPSTPPSSPVLPCASSSPAVASDLPYPPRSVKSPDLISSTSTQEVEGARAFDPSASSAALPVSLSSAISRSYSDSGAAAMVHLSESFPQVLRPVISNQWPKAPDVTRPAVAR